MTGAERMCGIAGYVGLHSGAGDQVLEWMARQLVHRGPDGGGTVVHGAFGLVHRRRAAADRDDSPQPARSADGRWLLACDGEIYQHRDLRDELATYGDDVSTYSDAELMLAAWVRWGPGALERFTGTFALAVADTTTGEVVLARDPFGVQPLYLAQDGSGRVAFASEIRAVLAAAVVPRRPDDASVYRYLRYGAHDDTERTFFDGVHRLLPGQLARVSPDGTVHRETYSRLRHDLEWLASAPRPYDRRARDQVHTELTAAVRRRLVDDVPVATALSGALPDSTVVATVDRLLAARDPQAAAAGPVQWAVSAVPRTGDPPGRRRTDGQRRRTDDEQPCVDAVARACDQRLAVHAVRPDPEGLAADLTDFIRTQQEPVASPAVYAQYRLLRQAAEHATVVLDGAAGAEVFAGAPWHHRIHLRELLRRRRYGTAAVAAVRHARVLWPAALRRPDGPEQLLEPGFAAAYADERGGVVTADLTQQLVTDLFEARVPALLRYRDRNGARFGVRTRTPYLDPALLRLLWGLDTSALVTSGWDQRALREVTAGLLPRRVRRRRTGPADTDAAALWLARMPDLVYEVLSSESFGARGYVDQHAATGAFRAFRSGRGRTDPDVFWRLVNLELWLREFIDTDPTVPLAAAVVTDGHRGPHDAEPGSGPGALSAHPSVPAAPDWVPHPDRHLVTTDGRWARFPLRTGTAHRGGDLAALAGARVAWFFTTLPDAPPEAAASVTGHRWYLFCSPTEPTEPIEPAEPTVDQAGGGDPDRVVRHVSATVRQVLSPAVRRRFGGTVVLDRNRPGVLGHDTDLPPERLTAAFADDPLGHGPGRAPFAVVVALPSGSA